MQNQYNPVVVVVAYDRPNSLQRILSSLFNSHCPKGTKLIVSIDNNGKNKNIADIANAFDWPFGEKEVIYRPEHLGLRKHIIECGDLVYKYDSIIVLEDDLFVSPHFYSYTTKALEYYDTSEKIAGISLYNLPYIESIKLPFTPIKDDSSVYFKQVPSSLGQAWSKKHWDSFKKWYAKSPEISKINSLPWVVKNKWPESSWKKYFYAYLIESNKYFVYPIISLTTNFNDPGTNMITKSFKGQVEVMSTAVPFKFKDIEDAVNVYDAHSEISAKSLNQLCKTFNEYNYEVDIYGKKDFIGKPYVLTTKACKDPILSFARTMKPHELNLIFNIKGSEIFLTKTENILKYPNSVAELKSTDSSKNFIPEFNFYFTNIIDTKIMLKILKYKLINKFKTKLSK